MELLDGEKENQRRHRHHPETDGDLCPRRHIGAAGGPEHRQAADVKAVENNPGDNQDRPGPLPGRAGAEARHSEQDHRNQHGHHDFHDEQDAFP